jgi:hypothetical protein
MKLNLLLLGILSICSTKQPVRIEVFCAIFFAARYLNGSVDEQSR